MHNKFHREQYWIQKMKKGKRWGLLQETFPQLQPRISPKTDYNRWERENKSCSLAAVSAAPRKVKMSFPMEHCKILCSYSTEEALSQGAFHPVQQKIIVKYLAAPHVATTYYQVILVEK